MQRRMLLGSYLMRCLLSLVGALATFLGGLAAPFTAASSFTRLISLGSGTVGSGATALRLTAAFDFDAILAAILGGLGISLSLFSFHRYELVYQGHQHPCLYIQ